MGACGGLRRREFQGWIALFEAIRTLVSPKNPSEMTTIDDDDRRQRHSGGRRTARRRTTVETCSGTNLKLKEKFPPFSHSFIHFKKDIYIYIYI